MGTTANPLFTSVVPGLLPPQNPTGNQLNVSGSGSGTNTMLPALNPSTNAPTSQNPLTSGLPSTSAQPVFGANTGGYTSSLNLGGASPSGTPQTNVSAAASSPIGGLSMMSSKDLSRMFDSLKKTYGDGMAHAIMDFLTSGAGFNQQAINNMLASLQPGIERGTESLAEQFSASGNRFGSGAQIGIADYLSQVNLNEGQLVTQMYEEAVNNYMNVLTGTGSQVAQTKAQSPSTMDSILSGLQLGGSAAQGLLSAGVGGGSGTLSSILSGIASAAAL